DGVREDVDGRQRRESRGRNPSGQEGEYQGRYPRPRLAKLGRKPATHLGRDHRQGEAKANGVQDDQEVTGFTGVRQMKHDAFRQMLDLLRRLSEAKIFHTLRQARDDALMIEVVVPSQRWEIEFVDYGDEVQVEIERFVSNGHIDDESALDELFAKFSDKENQVTDDASA